MWYYIIGALSAVILWAYFVVVMYLKKKHDDGKIPKWLYYIIVPFVAVGYLLDVAFNIVFGTMMFRQLPKFKEAKRPYFPTLSQRLYEILNGERGIPKDSFRWKMAFYICKYGIEPWDKNHCGLCNLNLCK
jgi:hypothetical protein